MPYGLRATRNRVQGYKRMLAATDDLTFQRGSRELLTTTSKWSLTGNKIYFASRSQNAPAPSPAPLVTESCRERRLWGLSRGSNASHSSAVFFGEFRSFCRRPVTAIKAVTCENSHSNKRVDFFQIKLMGRTGLRGLSGFLFENKGAFGL